MSDRKKPTPHEAAENALIAATAAAGGVATHIVEAAVRPRPNVQSVPPTTTTQIEKQVEDAIHEREAKKKRP